MLEGVYNARYIKIQSTETRNTDFCIRIELCGEGKSLLLHSRTNDARCCSGRMPEAGLLIPFGYLHPGKCDSFVTEEVLTEAYLRVSTFDVGVRLPARRHVTARKLRMCWYLEHGGGESRPEKKLFTKFYLYLDQNTRICL